MLLMPEKKGRAGNACRAIWPTPPRAPQDQAKGLSAHVDYIPVWNLICRDSALVYFFLLTMWEIVGIITTSTRQTGVTDMTRIADYTAPTKRYDGCLTISVIEDGRRHFIAEHKVDGKRAARAVAAQYNAKPWNF